MKDARLRVPLDPAYATALGVAAYCFARCEWNAAYCCEHIKPGSLRKILDEALTAGAIAERLSNLAKDMPPSSARDELTETASEFRLVVRLRNAILHGKPCTAPDGEQRLSGGQVFEILDLEDAADRFTACSGRLNGLLHGFLTHSWVPR